MRGLRSRWTVVALVPAFFLAGFGIVAALAGGSDEPDAVSGSPSAGSAPGGAEVVTVIGETDPAGTPAGTDVATTTGSSGAGGGGGTTGGGGDGGRGGGRPPAPPPGEIAVDYGRWEGMFELESPEIVPDFGQATLAAGLAYMGGVDCPVGLVRVKVWFFGETGLVGTALWESAQSTGAGGEVTGREPVPFEAYGAIDQEATSAAVRFTAVECL
ncbi:MAG: hypothetical protein ACRDNG_14445 [Gaiellaceae bacterium]